MREFYRGYVASGEMVGSLRTAMRKIIEQNPHPYFWATFVLVGKVPADATHLADSSACPSLYLFPSAPSLLS